MQRNTCRVCGNSSGNTFISTREMMFGFRDTFDYMECAVCGVLQIVTIPADISKYYPENYYSYKVNESEKASFRSWRQSMVYRNLFDKRTILGTLASMISRKPDVWMRRDIMNSHTKILDVGTGAGKLLLEMNRGGFKHLTGIDPFIEKDIVYDCGVRIYKQHFLTFEENFDFIMFHHSFEHMDEPLTIFEHIYKLLNPGCYALIRIPVADSFSKRKYGADWVNLDPPRHFYLHTTYSMNLLAKKSGLQLADVVYDSLRLQFYGSELYRRDMTLHDYHSGKYGEVFSKQEMRAFKKEADRLNEAKEGDWACYFFRKP